MAAAVAIGSLSALAQPSKKPGAQALDIAQERGDKAIAEGRDTVSDLREPISRRQRRLGSIDLSKRELAAQK
jgi:signal transduction histidine kinase